MKSFFWWLIRITPLRIGLFTALSFSLVHFVIQTGAFQEGAFSKHGLLHLLDLKALDIKFTTRNTDNVPAPQVVIAAIDEKSVERFGLWPWKRSVIGDFIRAAGKAGAKVVAFDAVFSDVDRTTQAGGLGEYLEELQKFGVGAMPPTEDDTKALAAYVGAYKGPARKQVIDDFQAAQKRLFALSLGSSKLYERIQRDIAALSPDKAFAAAVAETPQTVLGFFGFQNESEFVGIDRKDLQEGWGRIATVQITDVFRMEVMDVGGASLTQYVPDVDNPVAELVGPQYIAVRAPLPLLAENAKSFGSFNASPDQDGQMRHVGLLIRHQDHLYPALSLITAAKYFDDAPIYPISGMILPHTLDGIALGGDRPVIPTDFFGSFLVNYYAKPETYFPTYSIADFIDGTLPKGAVDGKAVIFGMTAIGLYDLRPTPFSPSTPGVYIHAAAAQNMIDSNFMTRFFGQEVIEIPCYLAIGILLGVLIPKLPALASIVLTLLLMVGFSLGDAFFIFGRGRWTMTVLPTLQISLTYIGISLYGYFTEGREKRKIRQAFQFYMSKSVVDHMLKDPSKLKLGGERRTCTVLFSDIRGFTTISEMLGPEQLVKLLNEYLTPMTNLVFQYEGVLDKYMGDAIMAIYGAPVAQEDHARRACWTSLDMMEELHKLQIGWRAAGLPELDIGIGLNTGPMSVGNMGSTIRFDYTVMGDNVNLGSRLEGINKTYGTNIIISQYTYEAAKDHIFARELDAVRVKGKREPVVIYELMAKEKGGPTDHKLQQAFGEGLALYKQTKWDEAIERFTAVAKDIKPNDYASNMYIHRCQDYRANPPEAPWDGVYTMKTK